MKHALLATPHLLVISFLLVTIGFSAMVIADHTYYHRIPDMIQASYMVAAVDIMDDHTGTPLVDLSRYGDSLSTRYYPPLYLHALGWVFRIFGVSYASAMWLNLPLALLALFGVYFAGAHLSGRWSGTLAAFLLAAYPGFRDACSGVYLDGAMACTAALAVGLFYSYWQRGGLGRLGGFAVASAASWLIRWTFVLVPATLLPAALAASVLTRMHRKRSTHCSSLSPEVGAQERNLDTGVRGDSSNRDSGVPGGDHRWEVQRSLALVGVSLLAAVPFLVWLVWYADVGSLIENPTREVTHLGWVRRIVFYPSLILKGGTGTGLGVLAGLALLNPNVWRSSRLWPLLLGVFGGLAVFVLLPPKHARYVVWLYPYLALITAESIHCLGRQFLRWTLVAATIVLAGATVLHDQRGRFVHHDNLLTQMIRDIDSEWDEPRPAHVLVHDRYYERESDLNAPVLIFANAAAGGASKLFVEGLHEDELVYRGRCLSRSGHFDFVVLPIEHCHRRWLTSDPFFACLRLQLFKVYHLGLYNGRDAEVRLYRVVSDSLSIGRGPGPDVRPRVDRQDMNRLRTAPAGAEAGSRFDER